MNDRVMMLTVMLALGTGSCAVAQDAAMVQMPVTDKDYCERVQRDLTGTNVKVNNINYDTYEGFKESKLKVDPVELAQFVLKDEQGRPLRISCKTKTTDHLVERWGKDAATGDKTCQDIHRKQTDAVYAALTDEEKAKLKIPRDMVVLEEDETVYMGVNFVSDYDYVWRGPDAKMHLKSKSLYVTWTDIRFKLAPEKFRGVRYCHLIAPEYTKRLILGEAQVPMPTAK
jgi:hypothetical protein